jgi:hypothetical protein
LLNIRDLNWGEWHGSIPQFIKFTMEIAYRLPEFRSGVKNNRKRILLQAEQQQRAISPGRLRRRRDRKGAGNSRKVARVGCRLMLTTPG